MLINDYSARQDLFQLKKQTVAGGPNQQPSKVGDRPFAEPLRENIAGLILEKRKLKINVSLY